MSRLIDADAIKLEKGFFENIDNVPKFFKWLGKQPTIDAVPVVRCRDCKHYKFTNDYAFGVPERGCEVTGFNDVDEDDFCSREWRKDGKQ